jgi:Tol biopolymer transport system component
VCPVNSFAGLPAKIVEFNADNGTEKEIGSRWSYITSLAWLPDGSGLVIVATEQSHSFESSYQVWSVSYPGGEARKISNDLNNYGGDNGGITVTSDGNALLTTQYEFNSNMWVAPDGDAARARQLTLGKNVEPAWTPDGRIVYVSINAPGLQVLMIMNADGTGEKQLSDGTHIDSLPSVSPDGRYVVFKSLRDGNSSLWKMSIDGGQPTRLTKDSLDLYPQFSPDGRWVVYVSFAGAASLWKVPLEGGQPIQLTDKAWTFAPAVSPDGKLIACEYREQRPNSIRKLALIPFEGGQPVKLFDLPATADYENLHWSLDGRALLYIDTRDGVSNIWSQPIDGGPSKQMTNFTTDLIFYFDWSRDGKQLAVSRGNQPSDVVLISNFK